uniref:Uncharacterized protein n=1 Tax=viral metagenome TaxID=1070528 RepID=A0A6C0BL54_9ZZZZ
MQLLKQLVDYIQIIQSLSSIERINHPPRIKSNSRYIS